MVKQSKTVHTPVRYISDLYISVTYSLSSSTNHYPIFAFSSRSKRMAPPISVF